MSLAVMAGLSVPGAALADWNPEVSLRAAKALMAPPAPGAKAAAAAARGFSFDFLGTDPGRWLPMEEIGGESGRLLSFGDLEARRQEAVFGDWFVRSYVMLDFAFVAGKVAVRTRVLLKGSGPEAKLGASFGTVGASAIRDAAPAEIAFLRECLQRTVVREQKMPAEARRWLETARACLRYIDTELPG